MAVFTIDEVSQRAASYTQVLQGYKDQLITTIYVNGSSGGSSYPTPTSWKAELQLALGDNTIEIYGVDTVGNQTATQTVEITLSARDLRVDNYFGTFDEFGLMLGLERLPGEKNFHYRNRLRDVGAHKSSSTHLGVLNAISREIGYRPYYDAVSFRAGTDSYGELIDPTARIELSQTGLFYTADGLTTEETVHIDPGYMRVSLTEFPRSQDDVVIHTFAGQPVEKRAYQVNIEDKEITFLDDAYAREWVRIRYVYRAYFTTYHRTITQFDTVLTGFTDTGGNQRVLMEIEDTAASSALARCLGPFPELPLERTRMYVNVYRVGVFELWDQLFQELFINSDGHAYGTDLEGWAGEIRKQASITWEDCILDRNHWDISDGKRLLDVLPHLWDTVGARWYSENSADTSRYTYRVYKYYGGTAQGGYHKLIWRGAKPENFKSGIGHGSCLYVADVVEA